MLVFQQVCFLTGRPDSAVQSAEVEIPQWLTQNQVFSNFVLPAAPVKKNLGSQDQSALVERNFEDGNLRWSQEVKGETLMALRGKSKDPSIPWPHPHTPQSDCLSWSCLVSIWCEDRKATPMWKRICQRFLSPCRYTLPRQMKSSISTTFVVLAGL